jgi:methylamine--corrinoid protein Co-methyltransferase
MIDILDVQDRSENGRIMKEREYDMKLAMLAGKYAKEFKITYDPETIIPNDDSLADAAFEAGLNLFLDIGVYCIDTSRIISFTEEEVKDGIRNVPDHVIFGCGRDQAVITHRQIEDRRKPFCTFSAVGTPYPSSLFQKVIESYAKEPLADTVSGPSLTELDGRLVRANTPSEVEAAIFNVIATKNAFRKVGRPGLGCHNLVGAAEKTGAIVAALRPEFGARKTDGIYNAAIAELKVDYERLNKVAFLKNTGFNMGGLYGPLMGGYAGGPAETALVLIAHHFLGRLAFMVQYHNNFPLNIKYNVNTTPEMLWLISLASQAIARNTRFIHIQNVFTASGPCTKTLIYELAAHAIAVTVSGANLNPAAPAQNKHPERATGMEGRIHAEIGHAVAQMGLKRGEANEMVKKITSRYLHIMSDPPLGKRFTECYDVKKVEPGREYVELYKDVKKELIELGIQLLER